MKSKTVFLSILITSFLTAGVFAANDKIGYLNLSQAFDEHNKTKAFDAQLEEEGRQKSQEREKMVDDIRRLKDELELLSADGRKSKQEMIDEKVRDLQKFDTDTRQMMRKKRDEMVNGILEEIKESVTAYGKSKGYSAIINDRVVLYSDGANDVTEDIIKTINK